MRLRPLALLIFVPLLPMCGSSTANCVQGASAACTGVGGCSGYQVCNAQGTYDPCNCGDAGTPLDASSDAPSSSDSSNDTSTSSDAPSDALGNWTPAQLAGLAVWLDDSVGVVQSVQQPGVVAHWNDQSGHSNNANPDTNDNGFTIDPGVINGHDAIKCPDNGGYLAIPDDASIQFGTGDFGIVAVVSYQADAGIWSKINTNGGGPGLFLGVVNGSYELDVPQGGSKAVVAVTNAAKFHIVAGRGQAVSLSADGFSGSAPTNTTDVSFVGGRVLICQGITQGGQLEIAELIAVKGTLADADLAKTQSYLSNKFKL